MGLESRDIKEVEPVKFDEWLDVLQQEYIGLMHHFLPFGWGTGLDFVSV